MTNSPRESVSREQVPPSQCNFEDAAALALAAVSQQSAEQLEWLGASQVDHKWSLAVLDDVLSVDPDSGDMRDSAGRPVSLFWRILTLHYLSISGRPAQEAPAITFADLAGGRGYASVYRGRVIDRLCGTIGREAETLGQAGQTIGGKLIKDADTPAGDLVLDFQAYPRVGLRLVWYAGDDELAPSASLLLPANIAEFFCIEDIVVLSERLIGRLCGGHL